LTEGLSTHERTFALKLNFSLGDVYANCTVRAIREAPGRRLLRTSLGSLKSIAYGGLYDPFVPLLFNSPGLQEKQTAMSVVD
jgi:hypothetical protein